MRKKTMMRVVMALITFAIFVSVSAKEATVSLPKDRVDVYYLHNTFRCLSCNTIENLSRAAIFGGKAENKKFKTEIEVKPTYKDQVDKKTITFQSVNIDKKENKHFLKDLKAESKYPVLVLVKDNKVVKSKVLDDAWDLMSDNQKFIDYFQKNLNEFLSNISK